MYIKTRISWPGFNNDSNVFTNNSIFFQLSPSIVVQALYAKRDAVKAHA